MYLGTSSWAVGGTPSSRPPHVAQRSQQGTSGGEAWTRALREHTGDRTKKNNKKTRKVTLAVLWQKSLSLIAMR